MKSQTHNEQVQLIGLPPLVYEDTWLVVLGSFPGRASLQAQEYYAFKRNHFWMIVGDLLGCPDLTTCNYDDKKAFLRKHHIGLWDVYAACCREGSLDANITAGEPNPVSHLQQWAPQLKVIAHNGATSAKFKKITAELNVEVLALPSTSPANASWSYAHKLQAWREAFILGDIL